MIADVTFEKTVYQSAAERFEAGTGNIADAVGLGAALDYVDRIGIDHIARATSTTCWTTRRRGSADVPGLRLIGTAAEKAGVLSFVLDGHDTEEVGAALDEEGIAVRAGHHCAQPILRRFGLETTVRPSLAFYNTLADVDRSLTPYATSPRPHTASERREKLGPRVTRGRGPRSPPIPTTPDDPIWIRIRDEATTDVGAEPTVSTFSRLVRESSGSRRYAEFAEIVMSRGLEARIASALHGRHAHP